MNGADFTALAGCLTGPDFGILSGCSDADLKLDADVDLLDFAVFQASFGAGLSAPGQSAMMQVRFGGWDTDVQDLQPRPSTGWRKALAGASQSTSIHPE